MRPRYRFPSNIKDVSFQFFGRFTWKDIIRITLPIATAHLTLSNTYTLLVGLFIGLIWYGFRPYNHPLDFHAYHLIRFTLWRQLQ